MSRTPQYPRFGFTLLELLVVLAIVVALFAILAPAVMSYRNKTNVQQTEARIKTFERALEAFATDHGGYPTTEQGLNALLYIPLNETSQAGMMAQPGMTQPGLGQPGMAGADPNMAMAGGAMAVGPEMLGGAQPGMTDPSMGMGMQPGMAQPGMTQPGMMQPGMTDPSMGLGMQPGMTDPSMGMGGMATGIASGWTQPMFNPALYVNARKRPDPYFDGDALPNDPWGTPFRYDNTLTVNGLNQYTGSKKPAIWSAGYDKIDGTEDDIRNWDPAVASQQMMLQQQQQGMGGMGTNPMDPSGMGMQPGMAQPGMMDPSGMGMQPGMTQPGMMQPGMADPMMQPGMTQPGMMQPGMTQPGMTQPGMMQPGMTQPTPMQPTP